jgi:hypothetical protein
MFSYFSWAILGVLYFLFFSAKIPDLGQGGIEIRAGWYVIGTNIFEAVAYLVASLLCWRNWQSTQMVSSRKVWLSIGLGMFAYFIGRLVFAYIEIGLKQQPDVSIANVFFIMAFLCLTTGMALGLLSHRIHLKPWQWLIVAAVGGLGSFPTWLMSQKQASTEQVAFFLNLFYMVSDVLPLIIAIMMLLAFWGAKVSLSWRIIAAAAFSLYIAYMWFKFAQQSPNYQSGDILEVFWVFSGVLFGLGTVLEYDASLSLKGRDRGRKGT